MKRYSPLLAVLLAVAFTGFALVPQAGAQNDAKIRFCKATGSATNPFIFIVVDGGATSTETDEIVQEFIDQFPNSFQAPEGVDSPEECEAAAPVTPTPVTPTPVTPTPVTPTPVTPTATDVPATATATATTVPGQPSPTDVPPTATTAPGEPTKVPSQPEPTKAAAPVTSLPSTGSDGGASGGGQGLILLMAATATLMAGAGVILTNRARGRQQK